MRAITTCWMVTLVLTFALSDPSGSVAWGQTPTTETPRQPATSSESESPGTRASGTAATSGPATESGPEEASAGDAARSETTTPKESSTEATDESDQPLDSDEEPVDLSTPRATMSTFLESMNNFDKSLAALCLDFSAFEEPPSEQEKQHRAFLLKEVIDRLGWVQLNEVPNETRGPPYEFPPEAAERPIWIIRSPEGDWLFSRDTVARLEELYAQFRDKPRVAGDHRLQDLFPAYLVERGFLLPYYQWILLGIVIFAGFLVELLSRWLMNRMTRVWLGWARSTVDQQALKQTWKPMALLAMAATWYGGTMLIGLPEMAVTILTVAIMFFTVIAGVWTAFHLIDVLSFFLLSRAQRTASKFDDLLIPLLSRTLKVFATVMGLIFCAEAFELPIAGLLSGLGIGGLAFAFAAKDTISNLFGSITVLVDRPFEIGDWVKLMDVEGTVETVGIRSTRIRTFYNSQITVPNSLLTTATVDNLGRRRYRRINTQLGVQYDTPPEVLDAFCEGIRELIRRHPYTRKDYYQVYLNEFSESSLNILLYCFYECPDWSVELRERHRLYLDILRLAKRMGVEFAFPTRTLHLFQEKPGEERPKDFTGETSSLGRRMAAEVTGPLQETLRRTGPVQFADAWDEPRDAPGGKTP
jgi:MscS family membrane protein